MYNDERRLMRRENEGMQEINYYSSNYIRIFTSYLISIHHLKAKLLTIMAELA